MDLLQHEKFKDQVDGYEQGDLAIALYALQEYIGDMTEQEFINFLKVQSKYADGFSDDFQEFVDENS